MDIFDIMTFAEASARWKIDSSSLRKIVSRNNILEKNVDYRKSYGTWLITKQAMEKLYGAEPIQNDI